MCPSFYALLIIALLANYCLSFSGTSSCYGDYQNILKSGSIVGAGIGNFISGEFFLLVHSSDVNVIGEDWTYSTAICSSWTSFNSGIDNFKLSLFY